MVKKCDTSVIHFSKKNHILGRIPYLYLRKDMFYCRIDVQQELEKLHYDFLLEPAFKEWKKIMANL